MYIPFESLPDDAKIWVYQADRSLEENEVQRMTAAAKEFMDQWEAHGAPLSASFRISHNQFLIIGVDENANRVTGCSTDTKVRFVQLLQQKIGVNFFDRSLVAILDNDEVTLVPLQELKQRKVSVGEDTLTFNNLITTKGQLNSDWKQPAGKSWLSRYI